MKNRLSAIFIIVIVIMGLSAGLYFINEQKPVKIDVVEINNIQKYVEEQWDNKEFVLPNTRLKFKVIDFNGSIKYSNFTSDNFSYNTQIVNSIKNGDTVVDVNKDSKLVGKLIIINDLKAFDLMKKHLTIIIITVFILLASICIAYIFYLNIYIYKPFKKLGHFAGRIAEGNLDIPLEMDKHNILELLPKVSIL